MKILYKKISLKKSLKGIKYPLLRTEKKKKELSAGEIEKPFCRKKQENLKLETKENGAKSCVVRK